MVRSRKKYINDILNNNNEETNFDKNISDVAQAPNLISSNLSELEELRKRCKELEKKNSELLENNKILNEDNRRLVNSLEHEKIDKQQVNQKLKLNNMIAKIRNRKLKSQYE